jgi:hypothetical protein
MIRFTLVAGLALIVMSSPASAQNALGAGDVLDANPAAGGNGRNPSTPAQDFRARNLIVTGNVAGGREFRGSVGYTADRDFRGVTGSDALFRFRADSAYSSPAAVISGISAARFNNGYDAIDEYRRDSTMRVIDDPRWNPDRWNVRESTRRDVDQLNAGLRRSSDSQMVGLVQNQDGRLLSYSASSVRGIEVAAAESDTMALGLSYFDRVRLRQDAVTDRSGPAAGLEFDPRLNARVDSRVDQPMVDNISGATPEGLKPRAKTPYEQVVERLAAQAPKPETDAPPDAEVKPDSIDRMHDDLDELKRQLGAPSKGRQEPQKNEATTSRPDGENPANDGSRSSKQPARSIDDYAVLLRGGGDLQKLSADEQDRLNELMASGEKFLRDGRYFDAQERFERALRITPNHPMAGIGLANAELGAGLYRSVAMTLRSLYINHPELIDVSIDRALLPNDVRIQSALTSIRARLSADSGANLFGLALAYIGRHLGDKAMIQEGLDHFATSPADEPLARLLRRVWLPDATTENTREPSPRPEEPSK